MDYRSVVANDKIWRKHLRAASSTVLTVTSIKRMLLSSRGSRASARQVSPNAESNSTPKPMKMKNQLNFRSPLTCLALYDKNHRLKHPARVAVTTALVITVQCPNGLNSSWTRPRSPYRRHAGVSLSSNLQSSRKRQARLHCPFFNLKLSSRTWAIT